jgi:hypothetical protein
VGVAATLTGAGWPIIFTLLLGFMIYRHILVAYLYDFAIPATRWQIDRIALEMLVVFLAVFILMTVVVITFSRVINLFSIALIFGLAFFESIIYSTWRGQFLIAKKKGNAPYDDLAFFTGDWWGRVFWNTLAWFGSAFVISVIIYAAQILVYLWFSRIGEITYY